MTRLANRHILLAVSGSIAAYKSADLIRRLRAEAAEVRVVMTASAAAFVTPLTLQALSGFPVACQHLDGASEAAMDHISLARWADANLIAPATANRLARLRQGLADDLLGDICLASAAPLFLAPAMNRQMWAHAATQENVAVLRQRGAFFIGPDTGEQACGEVGDGRMSDVAVIVDQIVARLSGTGVLQGQHVLITAGPTHEPIDPVRFISNHSSGRMGYALAQAAVAAGAIVTLISGPVSLAVPEAVECHRVTTAEEMAAAVLAQTDDVDIFIAAAAVGDYRATTVATDKVKKNAAEWLLSLSRNVDILATVSKAEKRPFCVGFAAETTQLSHFAQSKLAAKQLDMIAANEVGLPDRGFNSEQNALQLFWPGGGQRLPLADKQVLARTLITIIAERFHAQHSTTDS